MARSLRSRTINKPRDEIMRVFNEWSRSGASTYGAAVAFYTIFALAPLLVIAIAIAGMFLDQAS